MEKIILTLITAYLGYRLAKAAGLPAPAMIGSMLLVGTMNIIFGYAYFPRFMKVISQAIAGAYIGQSIFRSDILNIRYLWRPLVLLLALLTVNTIAVGYLMNAWFGIDLVTALLSAVAGGVTDISLISIDMNAETSTVALLQVSRLVMVMVFFPLWISWFTRNEPTEENAAIKQQNRENHNRLSRFLDRWLNHPGKVIFTVIVALISGVIGNQVGIPAGVLVFSILTVTLLNCTTNSMQVPFKLKIIAQLLAGSLVGCTIDYDTLLNLGNLIGPFFILILSYLLINLLYSLLCKRYRLLDLKSAMFAACPAGGGDLALVAADLGADMVKIAIIQIIRMVYVIAVMPQLIALLVHS